MIYRLCFVVTFIVWAVGTNSGTLIMKQLAIMVCPEPTPHVAYGPGTALLWMAINGTAICVH